MPLISVIIPSFNSSILIKRALASIFNQVDAPEYEVIVVDDASTDDSVSVVKSVDDPRIRFFCQEKNQGPAAARNRGIQEAHGKYIAFLDADDYWKPNFLSKSSSFLETHPEVICVFVGQEHKTFSSESSIEPQCLKRNNPPTEARVLDDFFEFWHEQGVTPLCSGSVLLRAEAIRPLGGQRTDFRICEDLEYWCLVALHGKVGFIPEILFVSDGVRGKDSKKKITRRQRLLRYKPRWKNARPIDLWKERLAATHSPILDTSGFMYVLGDIDAIMIYSMIQDVRWNLAYKDFKKYQQWMPDTSMKRLMVRFSSWIGCWYILCLFLFMRERVKR